MELIAVFLAAFLGWKSAQSNIILVIDWTKDKTSRIRGMRLLSVFDAGILVTMALIGYAGPVLLSFFLTKTIYLTIVDYESTFEHNK